MKKIVITLLFFTASVVNAQQLGLNTTTPNSTLDIQGSFASKLDIITATTTLGVDNSVVVCNGTNIDVILPTAIPILGRTYTIKNTDATPVNILAINGQGIDGGADSYPLTTNQSIEIVSNGTRWILLSIF